MAETEWKTLRNSSIAFDILTVDASRIDRLRVIKRQQKNRFNKSSIKWMNSFFLYLKLLQFFVIFFSFSLFYCSFICSQWCSIGTKGHNPLTNVRRMWTDWRKKKIIQRQNKQHFEYETDPTHTHTTLHRRTTQKHSFTIRILNPLRPLGSSAVSSICYTCEKSTCMQMYLHSSSRYMLANISIRLYFWHSWGHWQMIIWSNRALMQSIVNGIGYISLSPFSFLVQYTEYPCVMCRIGCAVSCRWFEVSWGGHAGGYKIDNGSFERTDQLASLIQNQNELDSRPNVQWHHLSFMRSCTQHSHLSLSLRVCARCPYELCCVFPIQKMKREIWYGVLCTRALYLFIYSMLLNWLSWVCRIRVPQLCLIAYTIKLYSCILSALHQYISHYY